VFRAMVSALERSTTVDRRHRRARAQAIAALCIGGMVVARALANRKVADELREGCMLTALALGGWQNRNRAKRPKS
jgi:TetR/AcrR family transcriptional repressor of nem operon